jgi:hypothetical protein
MQNTLQRVLSSIQYSESHDIAYRFIYALVFLGKPSLGLTVTQNQMVMWAFP